MQVSMTPLQARTRFPKGDFKACRGNGGAPDKASHQNSDPCASSCPVNHWLSLLSEYPEIVSMRKAFLNIQPSAIPNNPSYQPYRNHQLALEYSVLSIFHASFGF